MSTVVDSSASSTASDHSFGGSIGNFGYGQSFTGNGSVLDYVEFTLGQYGSVPVSLEAQIFAHAGTYGTSSVGSGVYLAKSASIAGSSLPGGDFSTTGVVQFTFSGADRITLVNGTNYVVAVFVPASDTNFVIVRYGSGHAGNWCYCTSNPPVSWSTIALDLTFAVYGTPAGGLPFFMEPEQLVGGMQKLGGMSCD